MNLLVHAGTLRGFGSTVVGRNIILELARAQGSHSVLAWVPEEWSLDPTAGGGRLRLKTTKKGAPRKLALEAVGLRRAIKRFHADAVLSLGDTSLFDCRVPHVLLVQQAFLAYPPERWDFPLSPPFRLKMRVMAAYLEAGLRTVDRVVVQTEHMRDAFAERWGYPSSRIQVIPSTVQHEALEVAAEAPIEPPKPPYLACVSAPGPHKDLELLPSLMARLAHRHPTLCCRLTVTARQVPSLVTAARRLGVMDRFDLVGTLAPRAAMNLVRGASVAVFPSRLESFGIPYHEAMALGRPIVASDLPCAREPLGAAARYARPGDPQAWADQVDGLLSDPEAARALGQAASERFADRHRTWAEIAGDFLELLRSI